MIEVVAKVLKPMHAIRISITNITGALIIDIVMPIFRQPPRNSFGLHSAD